MIITARGTPDELARLDQQIQSHWTVFKQVDDGPTNSMGEFQQHWLVWIRVATPQTPKDELTP